MKALCLKFCSVLALALMAFLNGCATPERSENVSERPWNAPQGWDYGIPSSMYQYR